MASSRYRFGEFVVSPRRRQLLRDGTPVPLISRYFDLLLLLLDRRDEAIDRREIFDRVWADVVVSDGALTQAIRTLSVRSETTLAILATSERYRGTDIDSSSTRSSLNRTDRSASARRLMFPSQYRRELMTIPTV